MARQLLLVFFVSLWALYRAETECDVYGGVYKFTHGSWEVTVLKDGFIGMGEEGFFTVPVLVAEAHHRRHYAHLPFSASLNLALLQIEDEIVLVDAGYGTTGYPNAGYLLRRLDEIGVRTSSITTVLLSHAHGDHVLGLLNEAGNAVFENARLVIGRVEHLFWTSELSTIIRKAPMVSEALLEKTAATFQRVLEAYDSRVQLVNDTESPVAGVEAMLTPGHSPGHMSYLLLDAEKPMLISGDTFMTRTTTVQNPHWNLFSEAFRIQAIETRIRLFQFLAEREYLVLSYHNPFPGIGTIVRDGSKFDWSELSK